MVGRRRHRVVVERTPERACRSSPTARSTRSMPAARSRPSPRRAAREVWSASVTPENEKRREGFGGGLALDGGHALCHDRLRHGGRHRSRQRRHPVDEDGRRAGAQLAYRRGRQGLFRFGRQRAPCTERRRRQPSCGRRADCRKPRRCSAMSAPRSATASSSRRSRPATSPPMTCRAARRLGAIRCRASTETTASGILDDPARPVIDKGVVFAVSHGGKMIATSESNGRAAVDAQYRAARRCRGSPATPSMSSISAASCGRLSRTDGTVHWTERPAPGGRWSGPVLAGGRLWLVSGDGLLVAADARSGQVLSNLDLGTRVYRLSRCGRRAACISWPTTPR